MSTKLNIIKRPLKIPSIWNVALSRWRLLSGYTVTSLHLGPEVILHEEKMYSQGLVSSSWAQSDRRSSLLPFVLRLATCPATCVIAHPTGSPHILSLSVFCSYITMVEFEFPPDFFCFPSLKYLHEPHTILSACFSSERIITNWMVCWISPSWHATVLSVSIPWQVHVRA